MIVRKLLEYDGQGAITLPVWWLKKHGVSLGDSVKLTLTSSKTGRHRLTIEKLSKDIPAATK